MTSMAILTYVFIWNFGHQMNHQGQLINTSCRRISRKFSNYEFEQHLHMEYISVNWYDIPELVFSYHDFLGKWLLPYTETTKQRVPKISRWHHCEHLTAAIMTWLSVTKYLCHKWSQICSVYHSDDLVYHRRFNRGNTTDETRFRVSDYLQFSLTLENTRQSMIFSSTHYP